MVLAFLAHSKRIYRCKVFSSILEKIDDKKSYRIIRIINVKYLSIIRMKFIVQYFLHLGECLCKIKCEILLKQIMRNIVYFKFQ